MISALTLVFDAPYRDIILVAGAIASVVGMSGLIAMLVLPSPKEAPASQATYNVSNSGPGFAMGQGTVNIRAPRFDLTDEVLQEIISHLDRSRPVVLVWRNTGRTPQMVALLKEHLQTNGFQLGNEIGFTEMTGVDFEKPILISQNGFRFGGMTIAGGAQAIGVDASVA